MVCRTQVPGLAIGQDDLDAVLPIDVVRLPTSNALVSAQSNEMTGFVVGLVAEDTQHVISER